MRLAMKPGSATADVTTLTQGNPSKPANDQVASLGGKKIASGNVISAQTQTETHVALLESQAPVSVTSENTLMAKVKDLEAQVRVLKEENKELADRNVYLEMDLMEAEESLKEAETQTATLKAQSVKHESVLAKMQEQCETNAASILTLTERCKQYEQEIAIFKEYRELSDAKIVALTKRCEKFEQRISAMEEFRDSQVPETVALEEHNKLKHKCQSLQNELSLTNNKLSMETGRANCLSDSCESLKRERATFNHFHEKEVAALKSACKTRDVEIAKLKERQQRNEQEITALKESCKPANLENRAPIEQGQSQDSSVLLSSKFKNAIGILNKTASVSSTKPLPRETATPRKALLAISATPPKKPAQSTCISLACNNTLFSATKSGTDDVGTSSNTAILGTELAANFGQSKRPFTIEDHSDSTQVLDTSSITAISRTKSTVNLGLGSKRSNTEDDSDDDDLGTIGNIYIKRNATAVSAKKTSSTSTKKQKPTHSWCDFIQGYLKCEDKPSDTELKAALGTFFDDVMASYKTLRSPALFSQTPFTFSKPTEIGDFTIILPACLPVVEQHAIFGLALLARFDPAALGKIKPKLLQKVRDLAVDDKRTNAEYKLLFRCFRLYVALCKFTRDLNALLHVLSEIVRSPIDKRELVGLVNIAYIWHDAFDILPTKFLYETYQRCLFELMMSDSTQAYVHAKMVFQFGWKSESKIREQAAKALEFILSDEGDEEKAIHAVGLFLCGCAFQSWSLVYDELIIKLIDSIDTKASFIHEAIAVLGSLGRSFSVFGGEQYGEEFLDLFFEDLKHLQPILHGRSFISLTY